MMKKILFAIAAVILFFGILEGFLQGVNFSFEPFRDSGRFWGRFNQEVAGETIFQSDPALFWRLKPDMNKHVDPLTFDYTTTNSNGFRGDEFSLEKRKGVFRIISLGDSSTFGDCVRNGETFSAVLKNNPDRSKVEVINAGIPGYTSHQVLKYLAMEILNLDPDVVIVMVGANDMTPAKNNIPDKERVQADKLILKTRKTFGRLKTYQFLMSKLISFSEKFKRRGSENGKMVLRVGYDDFVSNLIKIKKLGERKGFAVIFMTVPHMFEIEHQMNPYTRKAANQSGAILLDLAKQMKVLQNQGESLYQDDGGHPSVAGHAHIARMLSPIIKNLDGFPGK